MSIEAVMRALNAEGKHGVAVCPGHADRRPSLSYRVSDSGALLLRCHAGCEVADIVRALGFELHDLFPQLAPVDHRVRGERVAYFGADVLRALQHEILTVVFLAMDVAQGKPADEPLRRRALQAAGRLTGALDGAIPRRDRRAEFEAALRIAMRDLDAERRPA